MTKQKPGETWTADTVVKKSTPPADTTDTPSEVKKAKKPKKPAPLSADASKDYTLEIPMHWKRDTPGTFVYESDDPESPVTTIYIKRFGMSDGKRDKIMVIIQ